MLSRATTYKHNIKLRETTLHFGRYNPTIVHRIDWFVANGYTPIGQR